MLFRSGVARGVGLRIGRGFRLWGLTVALLVGLAGLPARADKSPHDWALVRLDYVLREKQEQLEAFCGRLGALAARARQDKQILACFDIMRQYHQAQVKGQVPQALVTSITDLDTSFNAYYIQHYFAFYDILFIDRNGTVFHSIRKERDYHTNLLSGESAGRGLSRRLSDAPAREAFVDFEYFDPSSEPAAFFIEPVEADGGIAGWIVLQCAINKFNTLMAWTEDLGQTGETFLVNDQGYMLTESNFEGTSTILRKRLDDRNIQAKFAEKRGHRTVRDYRGHRALTSFEVVEYFGTRWLVVAKIDEDEVVSRHFVEHRRYYADRLVDQLNDGSGPPMRREGFSDDRPTLRIDMDEFLKASQGERLHTFGISTCTGLVAAVPGKLAYLGHLSPKDKMYVGDDTDSLVQMNKRIKAFDIYR